MNTPQIFQIKIETIELVSKELKIPTGPVQREDVNFHFSIDIKLAPELKKTLTITDLYIQNKKSNNATLAFFKLYCVFEIMDFENIFKYIEPTIYETPLELEIFLKSSSLSTIRGIVYSELRGTYLQHSILPLIDIASIIKADKEKLSKVSKAKKKQ
jgi:hypothetical protein